MNRILPLVLIIALAAIAPAQSPEFKIKTFHVTEVTESQAPDECLNSMCYAAKIRVSGFVKEPSHSTIQYVLECTDVTPTPENKTGSRMVCARLEAAQDYVTKMYPTAVNFWADGDRVEGAILVLYNITSQREVH
jgi:hypothetical protein